MRKQINIGIKIIGNTVNSVEFFHIIYSTAFRYGTPSIVVEGIFMSTLTTTVHFHTISWYTSKKFHTSGPYTFHTVSFPHLEVQQHQRRVPRPHEEGGWCTIVPYSGRRLITA